ncbi:hypothetical protein F0562_017785 [Nyssa sinensis]|uniref:non-specific serine/threonine protein kinase n=1 Tax=Nyssa sinensis TaxID=561372 RepID=A0A5J4ZG96_9ASTE|nr:hypothetical protein F0562_017785 [Nyssa sinensis]
MLIKAHIHFPVRLQFSRNGAQTPLPLENFCSRRGSNRCLLINQSQSWSRTNVKCTRTSRVVVRAGYARRPMETPGAYQLIDDETGEKCIVWGGIHDDDSNIPSKEVLSWKPHINNNNRAATGRTDDQACSRVLAGSFGRLKAQRVRDLLSKTHRTKQSVNECDFDEQIIEDGPFHKSISSHSEHEFLDEEKGLDVLKDRRNVSRALQSQETRDLMQNVMTREDMEHSEITVKHEVEKLFGYQIKPTKSRESDIQLARRDVSVSRVSAASLRGWGNGESVHNFRFKVTDISKQRQKLTADSDFFSRKSFRDLGCSDYMIESLRSQLFLRPSCIQAMAFAPIIGEKSCIIADQSGSGKTLAYLVPVIQRLRQEELQGHGKSFSQSPRVVILVPTAELASQVLSNCRSMSKFGVPFRSMVATGGFRQRTQLENLRQDLDVLIATPGRFRFLIKEGFLQLTNLRSAVLDEVDILFNDEEFEPALQSLIKSSSITTQYLFVTATLPVDIYNKLVEVFPDCEVVMGPSMHRTSPGLEEILVDCSGNEGMERTPETAFLNKKSALLQLVEESPVGKTIVFCNKIETCRKVENALRRFDRKGIRMRVLPFHAAVAQESRVANMEEFHSCQLLDNSLFLVCTDRASRGIDFAGVDHVVLFDFPRDPSEYVRRVGRTARGAGGKGKAFVFVVVARILGNQPLQYTSKVARTLCAGHYHHPRPTEKSSATTLNQNSQLANMAATLIPLLCFLVFCSVIRVISSVTDPGDAATLQSLKDQWENTPPSWEKSDDPCGAPWEGVTCKNSRVTDLGLSSMGLTGKLSGDIGGLTELSSLDLSFNGGLTGSLSPRLGDLQKLNILILAGCGFNGNIPNELGNLAELSFLALNSNNFSGGIPPSLGRLSKLYWLDVAENQLTGSLPISTNTTPGLNLLKNAKHFHFNKNQLSGKIPERLFSSDMTLIHILFDGNQFIEEIPSTLGFVQTLEVLRLDRNALSGNVPSNLNNLTNVIELNLAHNNLSGPLPDLAGMNSLNYVDLSNNSFRQSEAPAWFSTLQSLTTLIIEYGSLWGPLPEEIFSFPQIQQVKLRNNAFNFTLNMGKSISQQLQLVDLQNNQITSVTPGSGYTNTLILIGNPVCTVSLANADYCKLQQPTTKPYSTSLVNCGGKSCSSNQKLSPQSCDCAYPYEGTLYFRGPSFRELSNDSMFHSLETGLWENLGLSHGAVSLQNPFFNIDDYLQMHLELFPSTGKYFSRSEILRMGFALSNQTYKPPQEFGPYYFIASAYDFPADHGDTSMSSPAIVGITIGCAFLVLVLVGLGIYAVQQKKRAERAIGLSKPFASWAPSGKDSGGAPQLKGARWFSYNELKKCTNHFSERNEIGSGGYGKVYRGMFSGGQVVAIKRAQQGSMQGGLEFKTEIELLSRVHHKNLVGLVGFCFEQGEQMLVYEFMPNGTLRESLAGRSGIHLDWKRRLRIALGSAKGLAYLHELANPPIIHRDVKSTNILLDENLTAKVADFGLSKLVSDSAKGHVSTQVKGTLGYLDPEYYMTQQLTEKSDVYSFGVVMLELVTAKQPIEKGKYIVREVRMTLAKSDEAHFGLREIIDPVIKNTTNLIGFENFLELAMKCVEESAVDRPMMSEVVKVLETILQNDGLNTNSTSASSSATDFGSTKGAPRHPYNDALSKKDIKDSDAFDYSGGYTISAKVEPK